MKVHAGQLKRNITLKQPVSSRNTEGGKEKTFTEVTQARARITSSTARKYDVEPVLLHTDDVVFRYSETRGAITKEWVINYDNMDHVIHSIEFFGPENKDFIKVICLANG